MTLSILYAYLDIWMFSFVKCLLKALVCFSIELTVFFVLIWKCLKYFLDTDLLRVIMFCNIFFHYMTANFILVI